MILKLKNERKKRQYEPGAIIRAHDILPLDIAAFFFDF